MHSLALALTLTLTFNHLTNELLQATIYTMLYGLMYLTYGGATEYKYLIRCATDYKWLLKWRNRKPFQPGELRQKDSGGRQETRYFQSMA